MSNIISSKATLNRLEQCVKHVEGATEPICIAVIGNSRTGSSKAVEEFCCRHSREGIAGGRTIPVVRVCSPKRPAIKGMAQLMLNAIGANHDPKGATDKKALQLTRLLKKHKTRVSVIEQFHHFVDCDNGRATLEATDWLKELADSLNIMLCVSGLESCRAAIRQNEQFASRFVD